MMTGMFILGEEGLYIVHRCVVFPVMALTIVLAADNNTDMKTNTSILSTLHLSPEHLNS